MDIIKKNTVVMTCGGCPSQWDAETIDGKGVFIRVRHGFFSFEIEGNAIFCGYPEGVDGVMCTEDMIMYVNETTSKVKIID